MKNGFFLLAVISVFIIYSCRKPIEQGKIITVSGTVVDSIKNKKLSNAKVYLYGARSNFYGIAYIEGPFDSATTDNSGRFSIRYVAEGQSTDYGVTLSRTEYGPWFINQSNYVADPYQYIYKLNYKKSVSNAVVRGRELNYLKIHLQVFNNPFDSFYVISYYFDPVLIKGQTIDTTLILRHLPNERVIIGYYTQAVRDTAGLVALNSNTNGHIYSVRREINDTLFADLSDTLRINRSISNTLLMPRR